MPDLRHRNSSSRRWTLPSNNGTQRSISQGKAFLVGVRGALPLMQDGGRIFAITYAEGSRTGGYQPWVAMGAAKAALESLVRYFAVAVAKRRITVNAISPGWTEDSVLNTLPEEAQKLIRNWHSRRWTPMGHLGTPADIGDVVALFCSEKAQWITGPGDLCRWRRIFDESRSPSRNPNRII